MTALHVLTVAFYSYQTGWLTPLLIIEAYRKRCRHACKETWNAATNPEGRWHKFTYNLPEPEVLAAEIIDNLEAGLNSFRVVLFVLEDVDQKRHLQVNTVNAVLESVGEITLRNLRKICYGEFVTPAYS